MPPVLHRERRTPGGKRLLAVPHSGQRERRGRSDRRHHARRAVEQGSPYGTERRTDANDRHADRRGMKADSRAGIGLTRDYFAQADERPANDDTRTVRADLITRFHG